MATTYTPIALAKPTTGALRNWQSYGEWMQCCYPLNEGSGATLADLGRHVWKIGGVSYDFEHASPGIYRNNGGTPQRAITDGDPWATVAGRGSVLDFRSLSYWVPVLSNGSGAARTIRRGEITFAFYAASAGAGVLRRLFSTSSYLAASGGGLRVSLRATTNLLRVETVDGSSNVMDINSPGAITHDVWNICTVSWKGTAWALYLNDPETPIATGTSVQTGWSLPSAGFLWYGGGSPSGNVPTVFSQSMLDTPYIFNRNLPVIRRREFYLDLYHGFRRWTPDSFAQKRVACCVLPTRSGTSVSVTMHVPIRFEGVETGAEPQLGVMAKMPDDSTWVTKWGTALSDASPLRSQASVTIATADLAGMTAGTRPWLIPIWREDSADDGEPLAMGLCTPQMMMAPGLGNDPNIGVIGDGHDGEAAMGTTAAARTMGGTELFTWTEAGVTDIERENAFHLWRNYRTLFEKHEAENIGPIANLDDFFMLDRVSPPSPDPNIDDNVGMWLRAAAVQDNAADMYKSGVVFSCPSHHDGRSGMTHYVYERNGGSDEAAAWAKQGASCNAIFKLMPDHATYAAILGMDSGPGDDYDPTADYEPTYNSTSYVDSAGHQYTNSGSGNYRDTFLVHADGVELWTGAFFAVPWGNALLRFGDVWGPADPGARNLGDWTLRTGGSQHIPPTGVNPKPWRFGSVQSQWRWDIGAAAASLSLGLYDFCHSWPDANDLTNVSGGDRYARTPGTTLPSESSAARSTDLELRTHASRGFWKGHDHIACLVDRGGNLKIYTVPTAGNTNTWAHATYMVDGDDGDEGRGYGSAATRGQTWNADGDANSSEVIDTRYLAAAYGIIRTGDDEWEVVQTSYRLTGGIVGQTIVANAPHGFEEYAGEPAMRETAAAGAVDITNITNRDEITIAAVLPHASHAPAGDYATDPTDAVNAFSWRVVSMDSTDWNLFFEQWTAPEEFHDQEGEWDGVSTAPVDASANGLEVVVMYVPRSMPVVTLVAADPPPAAEPGPDSVPRPVSLSGQAVGSTVINLGRGLGP